MSSVEPCAAATSCSRRGVCGTWRSASAWFRLTGFAEVRTFVSGLIRRPLCFESVPFLGWFERKPLPGLGATVLTHIHLLVLSRVLERLGFVIFLGGPLCNELLFGLLDRGKSRWRAPGGSGMNLTPCTLGLTAAESLVSWRTRSSHLGIARNMEGFAGRRAGRGGGAGGGGDQAGGWVGGGRGRC